MDKARQTEIIGLIHREVKPALGCTEPVAVALAAARAREILSSAVSRDEDIRVNVEVSGNILKNGMGVGIPGTGMIGLPYAAMQAMAWKCSRTLTMKELPLPRRWLPKVVSDLS